MNIIPIRTDTPEARADLSRTLRMMGTAGVELAQAKSALDMEWFYYRRAQRDAKRRRGLVDPMTPAQARKRVRHAIIRVRLARVCG